MIFLLVPCALETVLSRLFVFLGGKLGDTFCYRKGSIYLWLHDCYTSMYWRRQVVRVYSLVPRRRVLFFLRFLQLFFPKKRLNFCCRCQDRQAWALKGGFLWQNARSSMFFELVLSGGDLVRQYSRIPTSGKAFNSTYFIFLSSSYASCMFFWWKCRDAPMLFFCTQETPPSA